jgi:hypothetical protein
MRQLGRPKGELRKENSQMGHSVNFKESGNTIASIPHRHHQSICAKATTILYLNRLCQSIKCRMNWIPYKKIHGIGQMAKMRHWQNQKMN